MHLHKNSEGTSYAKIIRLCNVFLLTAVLLLPACQKENNATLTGNWRLTAYHHLATSTTETEPANVSRSIIMEFADNGRTGKMEGHTITNTVSGAYELQENNQMKTTSFGGTKVGEPRWGAKFWDAIHAANAFERQRNKLFIYFDAGSAKMEFAKE